MWTITLQCICVFNNISNNLPDKLLSALGPAIQAQSLGLSPLLIGALVFILNLTVLKTIKSINVSIFKLVNSQN